MRGNQTALAQNDAEVDRDHENPKKVEAPGPLISTAEGRAALLRYVRTKKGKSAAKYVPSGWE